MHQFLHKITGANQGQFKREEGRVGRQSPHKGHLIDAMRTWLPVQHDTVPFGLNLLPRCLHRRRVSSVQANAPVQSPAQSQNRKPDSAGVPSWTRTAHPSRQRVRPVSAQSWPWEAKGRTTVGASPRGIMANRIARRWCETGRERPPEAIFHAWFATAAARPVSEFWGEVRKALLVPWQRKLLSLVY